MYVYRFKNYKGDIIYIGKTQNMYNRMLQHFQDRSMKQINYGTVAMIEFAECKTVEDMDFWEKYLIGKYKPIYNIKGIDKDVSGIKMPTELKWEEYRNEKIEKKMGFCTYESFSDLENEIFRLESKLNAYEKAEKPACGICGGRLSWNSWDGTTYCEKCTRKYNAMGSRLNFQYEENKRLVKGINKIIKELEKVKKEFARYKRLKENE